MAFSAILLLQRQNLTTLQSRPPQPKASAPQSRPTQPKASNPPTRRTRRKLSNPFKMGGCFDSLKSNNPFRHPSSSSSAPNSNMNDVPPPAGPPPGYSQSDPKTQQLPSTYAAPPGPPPSKQQQEQHDWQSVPLPEDTSGYPPPPDIFTGHDRSWSNNATEQQAAEGERWCARYPLIAPLHPGNPDLRRPPTLVAPQSNTFRGTITQQQGGAAVWTVRTDRHNNDNTITAQPPLYLAARDGPDVLHSGAPKTIYFEVRVLKDFGRDAGVGLGFVALPYPGFRMPGWHRGSLAVHGDDGHKYINDRWGGIDFVAPWGQKGVVVGLGMTFSSAYASAKGSSSTGVQGLEAEVFFTRNGREEARWDVNEPRDRQRDLPPVGVQGLHDLVAAVGSFEKTEFEVVLEPARWAYKEARV